MALTTPTLKEIHDRVKSDLESGLSVKGKAPRFGLISVLAKVIAGAIYLAFGFLKKAVKQMFLSSAEDDYLETHGAVWDVQRKQAAFSVGNIKITGPDGLTIQAETILKGPNDISYELNGDATISGAEVIASVTAKTAGVEGNLIEGEILTFVSPIAGVSSDAVIEPGGISGGTDKENNDNYRDRILTRIQLPPQGGAKHDFIQWAKEILGVTRAWVYPNGRGVGTVDVTFMLDSEVDPIPNANKVSEVQDYLQSKMPVVGDLLVFAPVAVPLDLTIKIKPNTTEVQNAITEELKDLLLRKAAPGGAESETGPVDSTIYLVHLSEAISNASGEENHKIESPVSDFTVDTGEIATLGTITWQAL